MNRYTWICESCGAVGHMEIPETSSVMEKARQDHVIVAPGCLVPAFKLSRVESKEGQVIEIPMSFLWSEEINTLPLKEEGKLWVNIKDIELLSLCLYAVRFNLVGMLKEVRQELIARRKRIIIVPGDGDEPMIGVKYRLIGG